MKKNFKYPKISIDKIRKLGWKPTTNLPEGIKKTLSFFTRLKKQI